ncbi:MAG: aminotransferase class III-fold pyridoxal phosphate-dependent enzyme [Janthinobacterium lividum]
MNHLVGGISSSARVLPSLDGAALTIARSEGPYLFGDDGRRYVDTALGFGGILLGHADPAVTGAAIAALRNGSLPAFSHAGEERAAAALARHVGSLRKTVFTSSGSEAVHLACRIARLATGRAQVAKMAAGFDGWLDEIAFGNVATPEAAFPGGGRPTNGRTTLLRFNDFDDVERLFAEHDDIAAIVYEPMLANAACLVPDEGYLKHVEAVARRHGALLIADEVLMGFRLHAGLTSHLFGLDPDIATVGKAVGNGIPVAAVVARADVTDAFEARHGLRGGTYSGNPMSCAAVEATLQRLDTMDYGALTRRGDALRQFIETCFANEGITVRTSGYGMVFSLWFADAAPASYDRAAPMADPAKSLRLHLELRRRGALVMPSAYGRLYLSFAHDDEACDLLRGALTGAAAAMAG